MVVRRALLCVGFGSLLFSAIPCGAAPEKLTLSTSLDRAFRNNTVLQAAQKELSIAKTHVGQAKSLFYPKVNLNLNYVRYRNETLGVTSEALGHTVLEGPLPDPVTNRSTPFSENLYLGRVDFQQTLFAGGRVSTTYKLAEAAQRRAESNFESLKRDVAYKTTEKFTQLLSLREKITVLENTKRELESLERDAARTRSAFFLHRRTEEVRQKLAQHYDEQRTVRMDYIHLIGMEFFSDVDVEGSLDSPPIPITFQNALAWAKENRDELKATQLQAEADRLSVDLSLAERYPVFLWGGAYELRNSKLPLDETNWSTALSMNIPLFDGFSSLSRIKESRYRAEQGRLTQVQLEDQVEHEVRSAFEDVRHWEDERRRRIDDLKTVEKETTQSRATSPLEKAEMLDWGLSSRLSVVEAKFQLALAKARLEKAIGRDYSHQ
jgi:outer membrane protein